MSFATDSYAIFQRAVADYHTTDSVDAPQQNPYPTGMAHDLYRKCWIDCVQWHLEDIIRAPHIDPVEALALKRRIDNCNQERTDLVEAIDSHFYYHYHDVQLLSGATLNTESPAWAIDRLSILTLKLWHMQEQTIRSDATDTHRIACTQKLHILEEQRNDLCSAIDQLLQDLACGRKRMKVYRQMKMYNDPATNPALYLK